MANVSSQLVLLLTFLICMFENEACVNHVGVARRKRATDDFVHSTALLRHYFATCMSTLIPNRRYQWRSNVDFTVLDSLWFVNTQQTYCSIASGGETKECWQNEVVGFLKGGSNRVLKAAQMCIAHFAEDIEAEPPSNRYERRHKRQLFSFTSMLSITNSNLNLILQFSKCLASQVKYKTRRASLNFVDVSLFVESDTTTSSCDINHTNRRKDVPTWPFQFISITRPDSALREPLKNCVFSLLSPASFWTTWGRWGKCSTSCGEGYQTRKRSCRSTKNPKHTSKSCPGSQRERQSCRAAYCRKSVINNDFSWTPWSRFSSCSQSCGGGIKHRVRICESHGREVGIDHCLESGGFPMETVKCYVAC